MFCIVLFWFVGLIMFDCLRLFDVICTCLHSYAFICIYMILYDFIFISMHDYACICIYLQYFAIICNYMRCCMHFFLSANVCVCFCDLPEPRTPIIDNWLYLAGDVPYWRLKPVKDRIGIICCLGHQSLGFRACSGVFFLSLAF